MAAGPRRLGGDARAGYRSCCARTRARCRAMPRFSAQALVPLAEATLHLPFFVRSYTDFYASPAPRLERRHHVPRPGQRPAAELAAHADRLQRPRLDGRRLRRADPCAAAGASSRGRTTTRPASALGPARHRARARRDRRPPSRSGSRSPTAEADEMIFGYVLLNDWSARDIQVWEYQPLGPFQSKAFATSIAPWIVTAGGAGAVPGRRRRRRSGRCCPTCARPGHGSTTSRSRSRWRPTGAAPRP